jgi:cell division protein FtsQ
MKNDPPGNVVDLESERSRRARGKHAAPPEGGGRVASRREEHTRKPAEPERPSRGSSRRSGKAARVAEEAEVQTPARTRPERPPRRETPPERQPVSRRATEEDEPDEAPRKSHTLLKVGMLAMFLLLAALLGGTILLGDTFRIHNVLIEGTTYVSNEELIQLSGIREGENIFFLDTALVKQRIESNPMLLVSSVIRKYPDTVLLEIIERNPTAVVEYMGSYGVLDEQGRVLRIESSLPAGNYPLLTGLRLTQVEVGKAVGIDNKKQVSAMNTILTAFSSANALTDIAEINLVDTLSIEMVSRTGITIQLGDEEDMSSKANLVKQMLPGLQEKGYSGGKLLVDANGASYIPDGSNTPASTAPSATPPEGGQPTDEGGQPTDNGGNGGGASRSTGGEVNL